MKHTLHEILNKTEILRGNVKIGSVNGTSFFYCGKGHSAMYQIKTKINSEMMKQSDENIYALEYRLRHLDEICEERIDFALKHRVVKSKEKLIERAYKDKEKERKVLPHKIEIAKALKDTHLLDREVVEIRQGTCPDEEPCKIIYIKGFERGRYWTIKEFQRKVMVYDD